MPLTTPPMAMVSEARPQRFPFNDSPAEMVRSMAPGSVIVDLAAETGGNCELSVAGEIVVADSRLAAARRGHDSSGS